MKQIMLSVFTRQGSASHTMGASTAHTWERLKGPVLAGCGARSPRGASTGEEPQPASRFTVHEPRAPVIQLRCSPEETQERSQEPAQLLPAFTFQVWSWSGYLTHPLWARVPRQLRPKPPRCFSDPPSCCSGI